MRKLAESNHRNQWDFVKALRDAADKRGPRLQTIPANRYDPMSSLWWLSPHGDPAYKAGKIGVGDKGLLPNFLVGVYVEKGIGPGAAPAFTTDRDRRMLQRDDCVWHEFAVALANGGIAATCKELEAATGLPPILAVDAQAISPRDPGMMRDTSFPLTSHATKSTETSLRN